MEHGQGIDTNGSGVAAPERPVTPADLAAELAEIRTELHAVRTVTDQVAELLAALAAHPMVAAFLPEQQG